MSVYKILIIFNRECMECNLMRSFQILYSFESFLHFKPNDQFFLPFSVNYSQVAILKIMPALCLQGQGKGMRRGLGWWSTKPDIHIWLTTPSPVHICPLFPDPPPPLMCQHALWMASFVLFYFYLPTVTGCIYL